MYIYINIYIYIILVKTLRTDSKKLYIFKILTRKTNDLSQLVSYFYFSRNILLSFTTKYQT